MEPHPARDGTGASRGVSDDPYVYPGTDVLINKEAIRDYATLEATERVLTANRMEFLPDAVPLTYAGYRRLHRHLFEPIYAWAGKQRTVNIAKGNDMFCLVPHIAAQMEQRFALIRAESGLRELDRRTFANRTAEHACELNAIHPFRDGNGRTLRAFLEVLALRTGHRLALHRIDPKAWNEASIASFRTATYGDMERVLLDILIT